MARKIFIPIGCSGSGKSTYINRHFSSDEIVSPDEIRKNYSGGISDQTNNVAVWATANKLIKDKLNKMQDDGKDINIVLDATNTNTKNRKQFMAQFSKYPDVEFHALVFPTSPDEAKRRVRTDILGGKDRSDVPDSAIDRQCKDFNLSVQSLKYENFTDIKVIDAQEVAMSKMLNELIHKNKKVI